MFIKRFKKGLNQEELFQILYETLKEHPGEVFISEQFMAVWWDELDRPLIVGGDYTTCSEEEINLILQKCIALIMMKETAHLN
jgi:hypothetical protein